jgi:hypothetical protein
MKGWEYLLRTDFDAGLLIDPPLYNPTFEAPGLDLEFHRKG